jgi:hypothetical protein
MGNEPREEEIPLDISDLSNQTARAFEFYEFLPDRWEGMSATYLGKDYSLLPFLFDEYELGRSERNYTMLILRIIDNAVGKRIREKQANERRTSETKWRHAK